jgi:hypothetical protein
MFNNQKSIKAAFISIETVPFKHEQIKKISQLMVEGKDTQLTLLEIDFLSLYNK